MNSQEFIFWLQGFFEIADPKSLDERQIQVIKDHINLVLTKVTPDRGPISITTPLTIQEQIDKMIRESGGGGGTTPINPFPPSYPGVIPGISPLTPPYIVTCSTNAEGLETKACVQAEPKNPNDPVFIC